MGKTSDTAVVGAGPYGLSVAAHLRARRVDNRIFGTPLETWRTRMLSGMLLKSDGFASNLSAPEPDSTLEDFCRAREIPYHPTHLPVPAATFIDYGLDFQRRFVPHLEQRTVTSIRGGSAGFRLTLDTGEELDACHVVVAVGITHFATVPAAVRELPSTLVTHSSDHHDVSRFADRDVTVIGAGASAVELAVALAKAGAHARLVVRAPRVKFASPPPEAPRSRLTRLRQPSTGLGPGVRSWLCCETPDLFRAVPLRARAEIVRRHLGPSSPWHLKEPFLSSVEVLTGRGIRTVEPVGDGLRVELSADDGQRVSFDTAHVICATGYRADLGRLTFLDSGLRDGLRTVGDSPALTAAFESSERGLFFTGIAGAMTFGPLMRFMYGDDFAARRISRRIARAGS